MCLPIVSVSDVWSKLFEESDKVWYGNSWNRTFFDILLWAERYSLWWKLVQKITLSDFCDVTRVVVSTFQTCRGDSLSSSTCFVSIMSPRFMDAFLLVFICRYYTVYLWKSKAVKCMIIFLREKSWNVLLSMSWSGLKSLAEFTSHHSCLFDWRSLSQPLDKIAVSDS